MQQADIRKVRASVHQQCGNKVKLLIDKEIMRTDYIGCHPCENTYSLKLKTKDILDIFLPAIGHADFEEIDTD